MYRWLRVAGIISFLLYFLLQLQLNFDNTAKNLSCSSTKSFPNVEGRKLLIGIITTAQRYERRSILRALYAPFLPLAPLIDLRFVIAKDTMDDYFNTVVEMEQERYNDIIYLEIDENMNSGKTYHYLKHVYDKMSHLKYSFVFKADDDTFIHLPHLFQRFQHFPTDSTYWGINFLTFR